MNITIGKKGLAEVDAKKLIDDYIMPGVRREVEDQIENKIRAIRTDIGWRVNTGVLGPYAFPPNISVVEKVDAICTFLGVKVIRTEAVPSKTVAETIVKDAKP